MLRYAPAARACPPYAGQDSPTDCAHSHALLRLHQPSKSSCGKGTRRRTASFNHVRGKRTRRVKGADEVLMGAGAADDALPQAHHAVEHLGGEVGAVLVHRDARDTRRPVARYADDFAGVRGHKSCGSALHELQIGAQRAYRGGRRLWSDGDSIRRRQRQASSRWSSSKAGTWFRMRSGERMPAEDSA